MPPRTDPRELSSSDKKIRCVLVHDHVLLRQGLRRLLQDEPDLDVVSEAGNAAECLRKVCELQPDVLVADAATFEMSARQAEILVAKESPETKVVFLSTQEKASAPFGGLRPTTTDCAARQTSAEELVEMVRSSRRGDPPYQEGVSRRDPQPLSATAFPQERALTAREREVLKLLAEGKTVRAAATVLGLSSKTVDAHKFNLMRKLGIHNKAELVMWAIQRRVVKIPANF
ncbi:MAG TPA: response regulator transcription factor [Candidatus Acidoferrum sp.]|nr:response regulator transcription factor [Candidatus Acidoferrum sp.]